MMKIRHNSERLRHSEHQKAMTGDPRRAVKELEL